MKKLVSAAVLATAMFVATSAQATVTVYTNKAAFLAAAGATKVEDFSSSPVGNFASSYSQNYDGFTLSGNTNGNAVGVTTGSQTGGDNAPIPGSFTGQNFLGWGGSNTIGQMTFTFSPSTNAFGFDWFNTDVTDTYSVTLSTGETYNQPPFNYATYNYNTGGYETSSGFWGAISDTALSSATIQNAAAGGFISTEGFDNVVTSDVPEPAMLGLFGLGALGLGLSRRRKAA